MDIQESRTTHSRGRRARGNRQGRREIVRGPRVSRRPFATRQNKPEPHVGLRVPGRLGTRRRVPRGQINLYRRQLVLIVYKIRNDVVNVIRARRNGNGT